MGTVLAFVPRKSPVLRSGGLISVDWDRWLQNMADGLNAISTRVLTGPDLDPNGSVVASPGAIYLRSGAATSRLYVKESGVNTDTGWVLK